MFENVQWQNFEVTHNEFGNLFDKKKSVSQQIELLSENMLNATYENYIIDVFFEQDTEDDGHFQVSLIKDNDWNDPFMYKRTKNLKQLEKIVQDFVYMV